MKDLCRGEMRRWSSSSSESGDFSPRARCPVVNEAVIPISLPSDWAKQDTEPPGIFRGPERGRHEGGVHLNAENNGTPARRVDGYVDSGPADHRQEDAPRRRATD